jgi:hypothetical protein
MYKTLDGTAGLCQLVICPLLLLMCSFFANVLDVAVPLQQGE